LGGVFSQDSQQAANALKKAENFYKNKLHSTVSQSQVKDLIDQLDNDINWDALELTKTDEVLMNVRGRLDSLLKSKNPDYAEAMTPVDDQMRLMKDAQKLFGVQKRRGEEFSLKSDTTVNRLQNALKENKIVTQKTMERIKGAIGEDLPKKVRFAEYRRQFEEPATGHYGAIPAIKTGLGTMIGGQIGSYTGAMMGGVAGYVANQFGPKIASFIVDRISPIASKLDSFIAAIPSEVGRRAFVLSFVSRNFPEVESHETKSLTKEKAKEFLERAKGNKTEARRMAKEERFTY
jgi:hypothetical protein